MSKWLVTFDDGSKEEIEAWMVQIQRDFPVAMFYEENVGIIRALNGGWSSIKRTTPIEFEEVKA